MPEGVAAQTEQSMKNLEAILNEAGCTFDNVVKSTCYLADMSYFGEMNTVYAKYFLNLVAKIAFFSKGKGGDEQFYYFCACKSFQNLVS